MASNGPRFMVTWTIFKNHLLELGLTQNRETVTIWNLTTINLLYFIMCEDPAWIEIHWHSFWWRDWPHMTLHYTWEPVTTLHDFGSVLERPLGTFLGISQFHVHDSWLVCEVALSWRLKRWERLILWTFPYIRNLTPESTSDLIWSSLISMNEIYGKFNTHMFLLDTWIRDYVSKHYQWEAAIICPYRFVDDSSSYNFSRLIWGPLIMI